MTLYIACLKTFLMVATQVILKVVFINNFGEAYFIIPTSGPSKACG